MSVEIEDQEQTKIVLWVLFQEGYQIDMPHPGQFFWKIIEEFLGA